MPLKQWHKWCFPVIWCDLSYLIVPLPCSCLVDMLFCNCIFELALLKTPWICTGSDITRSLTINRMVFNLLVNCLVCCMSIRNLVCEFLLGNRCIMSSHLSLDGTSVNDAHAEVIARRAFLKYVFETIICSLWFIWWTDWWRRWCLERWKENRGEEYRAENGWTISGSGVGRKFTYSTERRRITARGERWCGRHWTPAEPSKQWMDGWIYLTEW